MLKKYSTIVIVFLMLCMLSSIVLANEYVRDFSEHSTLAPKTIQEINDNVSRLHSKTSVELYAVILDDEYESMTMAEISDRIYSSWTMTQLNQKYVNLLLYKKTTNEYLFMPDQRLQQRLSNYMLEYIIRENFTPQINLDGAFTRTIIRLSDYIALAMDAQIGADQYRVMSDLTRYENTVKFVDVLDRRENQLRQTSVNTADTSSSTSSANESENENEYQEYEEDEGDTEVHHASQTNSGSNSLVIAVTVVGILLVIGLILFLIIKKRREQDFFDEELDEEYELIEEEYYED
ncbi:MAG: TPM domain-containing protein [bacterium]